MHESEKKKSGNTAQYGGYVYTLCAIATILDVRNTTVIGNILFAHGSFDFYWHYNKSHGHVFFIPVGLIKVHVCHLKKIYINKK